MTVRWSPKAQNDLARLYRFIAADSPRAAERVLRELSMSADPLEHMPRLGQVIDSISVREFRRLFVGVYELRYEVRISEVVILRVFHTREER